MKLDIHDAVVMAVIVSILGAIWSVRGGIRAIRGSKSVAYYRLRQRQVSGGWWTIGFAGALIVLAILVGRFAEPIVYSYFPPSPTPRPTPTVSRTPTISLTPTITLTPSITLTPELSYTPTNSATPFLPLVIEDQFTSTVTPGPDAKFSLLEFSRSISDYEAVNPQTVFPNPVGHMYVTYSYDGMTPGVQWTVLWYRDGELFNYSTRLWEGSTGGHAYEDWKPPAEDWLPGNYWVVFFVGNEWTVSGVFEVTGAPATSTATASATRTPTASSTRTQTRTPAPSWTVRPSDTRWPSPTPER